MREVTWDEYAEKVILPLYDALEKGWYEGCKRLSENLGFELAPKERCLQQFLWIWQDNEMYDWMPENVNPLGLDIVPEGAFVFDAKE